MKSILHVFFGNVYVKSISKNDNLLHFAPNFELTPYVECAYSYNGAKESVSIRDKAALDYLELTTNIGLIKRNKITFRDALIVEKGAASLWWYHMTSCRDNTQDPVFDDMLLLYTVKKVYEESQCDGLVFYDFPERLCQSFASSWTKASFKGIKSKELFSILILKGIASRIKYAVNASRKILITKKYKRFKSDIFDIIYFGFWDWSVKLNSEGSILDKYHKKLPNHLSKEESLKQGWLVLFDPHSEPGSENRKMKEVILASKNKKNIVFLQSYMSLFDLVRELFRVKPLLTYLTYKGLISSNLSANGFNLSFLFRKQLLYGFLNSGLPHLRLVELATQRACEILRPLSTVSFLETYPFSRACYAGINNYNKLIPNIAIQHASRNQESLFFMSDLAKESIFKIEPSGLPKADYLCVMGKLGMELALKSGYDPKKVLLTGSPRFDHVIRRKKELFKKKKLCVIFAASGVVDIEVPAFIMAVKAIKSISNVELVLREHFFWKISSFSKIKDCLNDIEVSCLSLDEDLERADLILYTTTTLAEEALMRSIPVWQIASIKSNFSALRDVKQVKKIYSEDELKIALSFFIKSNDNLHANFEVAFLDKIESICFYLCDGSSSKRVANQIKEILKINA